MDSAWSMQGALSTPSVSRPDKIPAGLTLSLACTVLLDSYNACSRPSCIAGETGRATPAVPDPCKWPAYLHTILTDLLLHRLSCFSEPVYLLSPVS
jgi:hypothetical protein